MGRRRKQNMIWHPWVPRALNATQISFLRERVDEYQLARTRADRVRQHNPDHSFDHWHTERCAVVVFVAATAQAFIENFGWAEATTDEDREKYVLGIRAQINVWFRRHATP
ncbi:hypothetical protein MSAN_00610600 [Mycena sanguinolenta]|uniref:Uncharacterized protein n=1 Tax=Mycena sanguinolenta TaxID=230812 RepID=A0A8H7DIY4_9AGAR|nr:hypothetical protein MSAN_00610600 [Mycena sanguinolenta]